jgi:DNA (cytosine-5)-methyltransferase 1
VALAIEAVREQARSSQRPYPRRVLKSLELFTGAGGLALGTRAAGFQHVALVEWNKDACETLRANVAGHTLHGIAQWKVCQMDVRAVDFASFGPVDLIAGGPPCQPFSIGGKHRGTEDERNMIGEFIRAVRVLAPRAFILENVRGLLRPTFSEYFSYVRLALSHPTVAPLPGEAWAAHQARLQSAQDNGSAHAPRYDITYRLVNAADYGIPQTRARVFLIGFRADLGISYHFPHPTHSQEQLRRVQWITGEYWTEHGLPRPAGCPLTPAQLLKLSALRFPIRERWRTTRDALAGLPAPMDDDTPGVLNHRLIHGARSYPGHTGSDLDLPSKTLKAGGHGVPGGENMLALPDGTVRYLTVREAARLQTFPDQWRFEGAWGEVMRQLGNAVPMELAHIVARSVAERLVAADGG